MSKPEWEFAGIYADDGISGTNTRKREDFNRMIDDCMAGRIEMVITKSISRFARNTLDCLKYIRMLRDEGIPVYFEKENINTLDSKGEVLLTIMASLAQQESQSMSQNIRMGYQFRFQSGKVFVNHSRFLGYTKGENGQLVIVPEEASVVRRIFREYLEGASLKDISVGLESDGILTGAKGKTWSYSTVAGILKNEKYMGDALLQKTYTVDYLSKKKVKNDGIAPQYYVENDHEAIIPREVFMKAQREMKRRSELKKSGRGYSGKYALTGITECGCCGAGFRRITWTNREGVKETVWRCVSRVEKRKSDKDCNARTVSEDVIHQAVLEAINKGMRPSNSFMDSFRECLTDALNNGCKDELEAIGIELDDKQRRLINMVESDCGYDELVNRVFALRERRNELLMIQADRQADLDRIESLMDYIKKLPEQILEYDDKIVRKMVDKVIIRDASIKIILKNGNTEIIEM